MGEFNALALMDSHLIYLTLFLEWMSGVLGHMEKYLCLTTTLRISHTIIIPTIDWID